MLEHIYNALSSAKAGDDFYQGAMDILERIERHTLGRDSDGTLIFVNADAPNEVLA